MKIFVGKQATDFTAKAVMSDNTIEDLHLKNYLAGSKGVLFFYPLDFTFVCPSEIMSFSNRIEEFAKRNTKVVGISIDSHFCHLAWKNTPLNKGGIENIAFPLVSDINKQIARDYGVLIEEAGIALRGTFLIDNNFVLRHYLVNDLPLGRNVDETLRTIDALDHHTIHGEVCPAGWTRGRQGMKPNMEGVAQYLSDHADKL